ncbi:MAG: tyrosine-type recombinase/integrase [Leptolyngbyaceae cyanobacterium]
MFTTADFDISQTAIAPARKKDGKGQARHLGEDELVTFFNYLPDAKWRCVFAIAYFTGSRISEVLALDVSDIQPDRIVINVLKAKVPTRREIGIQPQLRGFLNAYEFPESGYLFPAYRNSQRKTHVSRQAAHKVLNEVVAAAQGDLDGISTHSFRRSFATNLAATGRPHAEIQRLLGHKSASMTGRYIG